MVRVALPQLAPRVTYAIVGITALVYLLQLGSTYLYGYAIPGAQMDWLELYGARINDAIRAGELWRFITPVLLHGSLVHIGSNMYGVIIFGPTLERNFGHWRFLLLYLLGGFAGNVLSFLLTGGYSVGASTAVFALIGAEAVFLYRNRKLFGDQFGRAMSNILVIVVLNAFIGLVPGVDYMGHIGGLLGGLMFAWFAGPIWEVQGFAPSFYVADQREPRNVVTGAALVVLVFGALAVWGMVAPLAR